MSDKVDNEKKGSLSLKEINVSLSSARIRRHSETSKDSDQVRKIDNSRWHLDESSTIHNKICVICHIKEPSVKKWREVRWKYFAVDKLLTGKFENTKDEEISEAMDRMQICIKPEKVPTDSRTCVLCLEMGDGSTDGAARYFKVYKCVCVLVILLNVAIIFLLFKDC